MNTSLHFNILARTQFQFQQNKRKLKKLRKERKRGIKKKENIFKNNADNSLEYKQLKKLKLLNLRTRQLFSRQSV